MDVEALTARIVAQGMEREGAARIAALLAPRLAATGVDSLYRGREKPSDHAPVWAEL